MKRIFIYIVLAISLISVTASAQNEKLFETAKAAYKAEAYRDAIRDWKKILDDGEHSAALYFNLGNAYYKLNEIGPSIYYYEKALQLEPSDRDIKNNLAFAENARVDAIEPLPKTLFATWHQKVSGIMSYNGWAISSIVFSSLFVLLFLIYYFSVSERKKRFFFVSSIITVFFLISAISLAFITYSDAVNDKPAIIFSESVDVKDAPSVGGEISFVIHEGTKVQILDQDAEWVRIKLADGKDGWILSSALKEL